MKLLLINTSEQKGGAAVACKRLMKALSGAGMEVKMLVRDKTTDNEQVISVNRGGTTQKLNFLRFAWERFVIFFSNHFSKENLFAVSIANTGISIADHPAVKDADILHLHWINQGFLSISEIEKLAKLGKPIVWTMHDMWPATAICHHSRECNNYQNECKNCFFLKAPGDKDLANRIFKKKKSVWEKAGIHFVTCSSWLEKRTIVSALVDKTKVRAIPNPLDIDFYKNNNRRAARERFGLPLNKKLILYGAANVTDKRKGIDYYLDACRLLSQKYAETSGELELVFLGQVKENIDGLFPFSIHQVGYLSDNTAIRDLYNAVDLFVTPSLEENLPNTIMESLSCSTPCVGFEIGGIPEMIDHQKNGYLAKYKSAEDLAAGIYWCLWEADYGMLADNARQKVIDCYSEEAVSKAYIKLYNQILTDKK
ncbi:MAG: glycosyltransferase family 4 protein [Bacteroidota bacterium]|nr:glycosyltransferase family 4 protein [Bacteroidota bacterium]